MSGKIFIAGGIGAVVGAIASYIFTKLHYEKIIDEMVSIKVDESEKTEEKPTSNNPEIDGQPELIKFTKISEQDRVNYNKYYAPKIDEEYRKNRIRSIPYLEYGEEAYDEKVLYLYEDGIIADDEDEVIENFEELIGPYPGSHIDEFDTGDMCYFVNDDLETYYELYLSEKSYYGDVVPPKHEVIDDE